jgi:ABC-2 type transport system ATP-binding protein
MAVIDLDDLSVSLGGRPVLRNVSAHIESRAIGLLGPNGAGKSTLIRTLLGFHPPSSGSGRVLGLDVRTQGPEIRGLVGYMPENDAFIAGMSAVRFVRYMAELHGLPPADAMERAHESLFWVGLGEARYRKLETFSLGMKQRVKLAQAIVHGPRLVLLDEPTNGLDPPGRVHMLSLVGELAASPDVCVVLSSHLLRDVEQVSDHVLILKDGRVAASTNIRDERATRRRFVEIELVGEPAPFLAAMDALGFEHAPGLHGRLKLVLPPTATPRELFAAAQRTGGVIRRLTQRRDTLEDVFLRAMGQHPAEAAHGRP